MQMHFNYRLAFWVALTFSIFLLFILIGMPRCGRASAISVVVDPGPLKYNLSDYQRVNDTLTRTYGDYSVRACPVADNRYDIIICRLNSPNLWAHPNKQQEIVKAVQTMLDSGAN